MRLMDTDHLSVLLDTKHTRHKPLVERLISTSAISNEAGLLSANLRDFEQVPGLRVEDWLYGS